MDVRLPIRLLAFESIDSTNEEARRRAAQGAPEGLAVTAETQTKGRGRRGRSWDSPPGNLYCSLLLRPGCSARAAANLSFAAALAVYDSVAPLLPGSAEIRFKWPNDVLLDGRKLAGVLLESEIKGEKLEWLIVGAGVNVAHFPEQTEFPATSLAAAGCRASVRDVMEPYFDNLRFWYTCWQDSGFALLRAEWLARAHGIGETTEVRLGNEWLRGRFVDIDSHGALLLETAGGLRSITAGDVFFPDTSSN